MFGGKQSSNGKPAAAPSGGGAGLNSLVKGTHIEGKIKAPSDIRIEGTLEGDLDCQAKVIIGPSGMINGNVTCRTAMIEGKFEGNCLIRKHLKKTINLARRTFVSEVLLALRVMPSILA